MDKELLQAFAKRTTQASRTELVVIQYEIILQSIKDAKKALLGEDDEGFGKSLNFANTFVKELIGTLDYQYTISYDLLNLYLYICKCLAISMVKKEDQLLEDVVMIVDKLLYAFMEISKEDIGGSVMQNVQQVYAGLTYGRNNLNETLMNQDSNRGFKA